jgi:tetratricopeptide (TPR) repeat protein
MNRQRQSNSKFQQIAGNPCPQAAARGAPPDPADLLHDGFRHHQAGRLTEAEACYRRVLAAQPRQADALHLLGVVSHQAGRSDLAVELIRLAIKQSGQPAFYLNLGTALKEQRRLDEAVAAYHDAIRIKPDFAEAHFALGNVLIGLRRLDEAGAAYRKAIRIKPDFAEAHFNIGHVLAEQLRFDEAAAAYRQAIHVKPDYAEAYCNLGAVLRRAGKASEAIAEYQRALAINS